MDERAKQELHDKLVAKHYGSHRGLDALVNRCIYAVDSTLKSTTLLECFHDVERALKAPVAVSPTSVAEWTLMCLIHTYVPPNERLGLTVTLMKENVLTSTVHRTLEKGHRFSYRLLILDCLTSLHDRRAMIDAGRRLIPVVESIVTPELCDKIAACVLEATGAEAVALGTRPPPRSWGLVRDLLLHDYYVDGDLVEGGDAMSRPTTKLRPVSTRFTVNVDTNPDTNMAILDVTVPIVVKHERHALVTVWEVLRVNFLHSKNQEKMARTFEECVRRVPLYHAPADQTFPFYDLQGTIRRLYNYRSAPGIRGCLSTFAYHVGETGRHEDVLDDVDQAMARVVRAHLTKKPRLDAVTYLMPEHLEDLRF